MSFRTRLLDLLPVLLVFAIVSAFATFVVIEYVVREPIVVPAPEHAVDSHGRTIDDAPPSSADDTAR